MRRVGNDFHLWLRHSWKSLPNRLSRDKKIIIHGNSCIILDISLSWASYGVSIMRILEKNDLVIMASHFMWDHWHVLRNGLHNLSNTLWKSSGLCLCIHHNKQINLYYAPVVWQFVAHPVSVTIYYDYLCDLFIYNSVFVNITHMIKLSNIVYCSNMTVRKPSHDIETVVVVVCSSIKVNSSPSSATYMCQWTGSALVQIMACHLFVAKPFSNPMLGYC